MVKSRRNMKKKQKKNGKTMRSLMELVTCNLYWSKEKSNNRKRTVPSYRL